MNGNEYNANNHMAILNLGYNFSNICQTVFYY